jgi:murein L,D-transpeptidase YcbB/YkuD
MACVLALAPVQALDGRATPSAAARAAEAPLTSALHRQLTAADTRDLSAVYRERGDRPLWFEGARPRPEAYALVSLLAKAGQEGLDPRTYAPERLRAALLQAQQGGPVEAARTEIALSQAFARYAVDLRTPPQAAELIVTDPDAAPPRLTPHMALLAAARAPSLRAHLTQLAPANPVYRSLRVALAAELGRRGGGDSGYARQLRLNLARARALPPDSGGRFVLVNAATAQLWLYEDGQVRQTMAVAVGKPSEPTPLMSGMIRYAVLDPYWNVPPDLVRDTFAPQVLGRGVGVLTSHRMEVLSDWSNQAQVVDPGTVDWAAVAAGRETVRMRQRPGPDNMMGAVKLMLPNRLGVYLHDTPDKTVFSHAVRTFSAGCVRLSDATALASVLLSADPAAKRDGSPEQRVDLPRPVPVYIAYFTALPRDGGVALARDVYRRDAPLLAELDASRRGERLQLAAR